MLENHPVGLGYVRPKKLLQCSLVYVEAEDSTKLLVLNTVYYMLPADHQQFVLLLVDI